MLGAYTTCLDEDRGSGAVPPPPRPPFLSHVCVAMHIHMYTSAHILCSTTLVGVSCHIACSVYACSLVERPVGKPLRNKERPLYPQQFSIEDSPLLKAINWRNVGSVERDRTKGASVRSVCMWCVCVWCVCDVCLCLHACSIV